MKLTATGSSVRIRLSSLFVDTPTPIGEVTIASKAVGGTLVPGTSRSLQVGGRTAFTIPADSEVTTDALRLPVQRGDEFLVSIFVAGPITGFSNHFDANATGYCTAPGGGNHTGDTTTNAMPVVGSGIAWLTGVDVLAGPTARTVVALGDSITDGTASTIDAYARWTDRLATRLDGTTISVANAGLAGNAVLVPPRSTIRPGRSGPSALSRFDRDVLGQAGVSSVILFEGTNDICYGMTGDSVIDGLRQLVDRAHSAGLRVIGATLIGREGGACGQVDADTAAEARATVNAWVRTTSKLDGVIDFAKVVNNTDPTYSPGDLTHSRVYDTFDRAMAHAYDSGDHVHPNDAGYAAMADAIDLTLFR